MKKDAKSPAVRAAVDWSSRLPGMSDDAIANLLKNAHRLRAGNADSVQAAAASDLLPAIEEEMAQRKARRAAASPKKPPKARAAPSRQAAEG